MSQADEVYKSADKKVNSFRIPFFTDGKNINEKVAELYEKAGNLYRVEFNDENALQSYINASKYYILSDNDYNAIKCYKLIAQLHGKLKNIKKEIMMYLEMINLLKETDKYAQIGRLYIKIAEIYDKENDINMVIQYYELAVEYLKIDNEDSERYVIKMADYLSIMVRYNEAIKFYEKIAKKYVDNHLKKFQVKKILCKALLCQMIINDRDDMDIVINIYKNIDFTFERTEECQLIERIMMVVDIEDFQIILREYDNINKFDVWDIMILSRIKEKLEKIFDNIYIDLA